MNVYAPDLPAHGATRSSVTRLEDMAAMITEYIRQDPATPTVLAGHSTGAIIAVQAALAIPDNIARLVLIAPAGVGRRINQDFLDDILGAATPDALVSALAMTGENGAPVSPAYLEQLLSRLANRRRQLAKIRAGIAVKGIQQKNILPDLAGLTCPVTAIFSRGDPIIPWQQAADLPPNVCVRFLQSGTHMPHRDQPRLIASLMQERTGS